MGPYCRVVDNSSGSELCRYSLREAGHESGLIVSKIARETGGRWGFHALGLPCKGRTYKDSMPEVMRACMQDTRKLMQRGTTTMDIPTHSVAPPAQSAYGAPPAHSAFGGA